MKPHGRDCPHRCSICLGAPVTRIDQDGASLVINGVAVRAIATEPWSPGTIQARKRGGLRHRRRKTP